MSNGINHWANEFYSQFGEDSVVFSYFRSKAFGRTRRLDDIGIGFYVDVGSHHPTIISNTWFFYQKGWRGINIDPTPGVKEDFDRLRPRDINIQAAISSTDGSASFYSYGRTVHNTMDPSRTIKDKEPERLTVKSIRLSTLLSDYLPEGEQISLLSVDVEGVDLEVLQSNDWNTFRPEIIVVELHEGRISHVISSEIFQYTVNQGYELFGWTPPSLIFRRR